MQKSYAQLGQDLLANRFFKYYPANHKVFLDVGAFDGIGFSNSRLFFEKGWSGVCVEPVSKNFEKLQKLYAGTSVLTVRFAASDYDGQLELNVATIPWAEDWGSDVSSPSDETKERWPDYKWEKEVVPATTVNKILETNKINAIDFVSIDVEGQELAVLRGFDLQKHHPTLLVVEYSTSLERQELLECMKKQGYFHWLDNGQDIFFVRGKRVAYWRILPLGLWFSFDINKVKSFFVMRIKRFLNL
jgi:FkbM family methyltransferase